MVDTKTCFWIRHSKNKLLWFKIDQFLEKLTFSSKKRKKRKNQRYTFLKKSKSKIFYFLIKIFNFPWKCQSYFRFWTLFWSSWFCINFLFLEIFPSGRQHFTLLQKLSDYKKRYFCHRLNTRKRIRTRKRTIICIK